MSTIQEELQAALAERGQAHRIRSQQRGREARRAVPRASHAQWEPPADRGDPISLLQAQDQSRVAELVPIRYGRMARSPLSFFRGTAAIMAADLAQTQVSGLQAQLNNGTLHIAAQLPEAVTLVNELGNFRANISETTGIASFGARQGQHDDLVLSLALAVWWLVGPRSGGSKMTVQPLEL